MRPSSPEQLLYISQTVLEGDREGLRLLSNFQNLLLRQLELKALSKSAGAGDKPGDVDQPDIDVDKPREDTSIDKQMHC